MDVVEEDSKEAVWDIMWCGVNIEEKGGVIRDKEWPGKGHFG